MKHSTRLKIIDSSISLFSTVTYCKVSLRLIASKAGCAHSLVHREWATKEDLFKEALVHCARDLKEDLILKPSLVTELPPATIVMRLLKHKDHILLKLLKQIAMNPELSRSLQEWDEGMNFANELLNSFESKNINGVPELDGDTFSLVLVSVMFSESAADFLRVLGWDEPRVQKARHNALTGFMRLAMNLR